MFLSSPSPSACARQRESSRRHRNPEKAYIMPPDQITVDNIDQKLGRLTGDLATRILLARHSPLSGFGDTLVSMFYQENVSAWIGLAIMAEEASYGVRRTGNNIDERNIANPFSVHFTSPARWPAPCHKNALLIPDGSGKYEPDQSAPAENTVDGRCAVDGYRLPSFAESAQHAINAIRRHGLDSYRETSGYKNDLNDRLRDLLRVQRDIIFGK